MSKSTMIKTAPINALPTITEQSSSQTDNSSFIENEKKIAEFFSETSRNLTYVDRFYNSICLLITFFNNLSDTVTDQARQLNLIQCISSMLNKLDRRSLTYNDEDFYRFTVYGPGFDMDLSPYVNRYIPITIVPYTEHSLYELDDMPYSHWRVVKILDDDPRNLKPLHDSFIAAIASIEEVGEANGHSARLYLPLWYAVLIQSQIKDRVFEHPIDLIEVILNTKYEKRLPEISISQLSKMDPELMDAHLKLLAAKKKLTGKMTHLSNLKTNLAHTDPQNLTSISDKENGIRSAEAEIDYHMLRIKTEEDRVALLTSMQQNRENNNSTASCSKATPCMDTTMQGEAENIADHSENTALGSTTIEIPTIVTASPPDNSYLGELTSDNNHQYPDLTGRWILFDTVTLDRTITRGSVIKQIHLPADAVLSRWNTPNMNPFKIHEFFSGGIQVKAQWNIPKTNQFAAELGTVYHWLQRDRPAELVNVWSVSQQPGGQLHGHSQNSTEIDIPYMSYLPMIPIRPNNFCMNLYYATISIIALTNFEVPPGAVDTASLTLYIKFADDFRFYGQKFSQNGVPNFDPYPRSEKASPQMFKAAAAKTAANVSASVAKAGSSILGSAISSANTIVRGTLNTATRGLNRGVESIISQGLASITGNRDKPLSLENCALHQRATTNIASGSGHYSGDSLRLVQTGNTPHPDFLFGVEKYASIQKICETEGFVNSFTITTRQPQGTLLFSMRLQLAQTGQVTHGANYPTSDISNWTPCDHIAGWFSNYNGVLHIRLVPVADGFKTFRIRVCHVINHDTLTYDDSQSVYYETFDVGADLNTQLSFDFFTQFIHNEMNFNFRTPTNQGVTAGSLHIFLETELNVGDNLTDTCDVLVYKRVAPGDFAFSVPRPNISVLTYNEDEIPLPPIPDPPPPPPVPVWNNASVVIRTTTFNLNPGGWTATLGVRVNTGAEVLKPISSVSSAIFFINADSPTTLIRDASNHDNQWAGFVQLNCLGTWNPSTIAVSATPDPNPFIVLPAASISTHTPATWTIQYQGAVPFPTMLEDEFVQDLTTQGIEPNPGPVWTKIPKAKPAMDAREAQTDNLYLTHKISVPNESMHGESHMDLLTNLRRFNFFRSVELTVPSGIQSGVFRMPVSVGGAVLRDQMNTMQRSDKITHIHDAWRYYRGSVRYMIVVDSPDAGVLWLEHVPQVTLYPFNETEQTAPFSKNTSGYAESILAITQNVTHQIEIPMYVPTCGVLNASYTSGEYLTNVSQGLGVLNFYWSGPATNLRITIYRSVGDDAAFYCFNGFPIRQVVDISPEPIPFYRRDASERARPAMFKAEKERMYSTLDRLDTTLDVLAKTGTSAQDFLSKVTDFDVVGNHLGTVLLQVGHIIANPTKTHFALSGAQILLSFGFLNISLLGKLENILTKVWTDVIDFSTRTLMEGETPAEPANATMENSNCLVDLSATLTSAVCAYADVRSKKVDFSERLAMGFVKGATIHQKILGFFETIFKYIVSILKSILQTYFPSSPLLAWLEEDICGDWIKQVNTLTDPTIERQILTNPKACALVYHLVNVGDQMALDLRKAKRSNGNLARLILQSLEKLKKVRQKISREVDTPRVKYNPFVFYIAGSASQVGKSRMVQSLSCDIANSTFGLGKSTKPIFVVPESEKFWEKYDGQKVIVFDDFGRMTHADVADSDSARLCAIKGEADFTVPKAFEDKGMIAVPWLVGCASNYTHPKVNGVTSKIVWERRNVVYEVLSDLSVYKTCPEHTENFRFACGFCRNSNAKDCYLNYPHLSFKVCDVQTATKYYGNVMSYVEMKEDLINRAKSYYAVEDENYAEKLQELKKRSGEKELAEFLIPNEPIKSYKKLLESGEFDNIIAELGGTKANACMMRSIAGFLGFLRPEFEEEEVVYERFCGHLDLTTDSKIVFDEGGYSFPGTPFTHELCSEDCSWLTMEPGFLADLDKKYRVTGAYPKHFPMRFNTYACDMQLKMIRSEKEQILADPQVMKVQSLLSMFAAGVALIGAGWLLWKIVKPSETKEVAKPADVVETVSAPTPTVTESALEMSSAHPCLMSSGDVKTKFASKFKVGKSFSVGRWESARPQEDNELEAMIKTYEAATIDVCVEGDYATARAVCVSPNLYVTQLHSLLNILAKASERVKMALMDTICDAKCTENEHSSTHRLAAAMRSKIIFKRRCNNQCQVLSLTLHDWFKMNGSTFCCDQAGCDIGVFRLVDNNFQTPNIRKYLVNDTTAPYVHALAMAVHDPGRIGSNIQKKSYPAEGVVEYNSNVEYDRSDICSWTTLSSVYFLVHGYTIKQIDEGAFIGSCGSILYDKVTLRIVGFLCASNAQKLFFNSFSENDIIRVEKFYQSLNEAGTLEFGTARITLVPAVTKFITLEKAMECKTMPAMNVYHSTKTSIKESVCHEKFGEVVRRPCHISQNGDKGEKSMEAGLQNYYPHKSFPTSDIREAVAHVKSMFRKKCKPSFPVVSRRSMTEAIDGIPGYVPRMCMSTGPGFPWCSMSGKKRKKDLVKIDDDHNIEVHEDLVDLVENNLRKMERGEKPLTIFQLSHKDERLALHKLDNVRLIQGSPFDTSIIMRMVLMDFNLAFQQNRKHLEHQVGINIASLEWDEMTRSLTEFSPHICVGDFSKFGPRLLTEFVLAAYEIMNDWYAYHGADEDTTVRKTLGECVSNCYNIAYNRIIKVECGSPSGAINTVIINSICNMLYNRCAWIGIMKKKCMRLSSLGEFEQHVKFVCYGDDVIFAVKPEVIDIYNNQTISDYMKEFDVKYTDVTKGEEMRKCCTIQEASFLKCGFRWFEDTMLKPGVWLCLPDLKDIKDTTNWVRVPKGIRKGADINHVLLQAALANCDDALRRSWFHGRNTFEAFRDEIEAFWKDYPPEYQPRFHDFDGLQREYGYPQKCGDLRVEISEYVKELREQESLVKPEELRSASASAWISS